MAPDFSASGVPFRYLPAPTIERASPPAGARGGGMRVLIAGCGFVDAGDDLRCRFGATAVTACWLSKTALEYDAPPLLDETAADDDTDASGVVALVALEVSFNGGAGASYGGVVDLLVTANGAFFEYFPTSDAARVDALAPTRGGARVNALAPARGGTHVFVFRAGFVAAAADEPARPLCRFRAAP